MIRVVFFIALVFPLLSGLIASKYYPGGFALAQANDGSTGNAWAILLLAVVMIVGVISSFIFELARKSKLDNVAYRFKPSELITDIQFIAALFVSPLVFNSVYALTGQNPETLGDFLLAYQNGFFWQTVLMGISNAQNGGASGTTNE